MEIRGHLAENSLPALLQGLQAFAASGTLTVIGPDAQQLEVGFEHGRVVWARQGHLRGEEALLASLLWEQGSYHFRGAADGTSEKTDQAELRLPEGFDLTRFLLQSMVFADELEKRFPLLPPASTPMRLKDQRTPEDPFGCGLDTVTGTLQQKGAATLAELVAQSSLAPVKVQLAVALLQEQGLLEYQAAATPATQAQEVEGWWSRVSERFGGSLRLLLLVDEATCSDAGFQRLVGFLKEKLGVSQAWESFAKSGPSFVRLHPHRGGVVSVCCLPSRQAAGRADYLAFVATHQVAVALGPAALPLLPDIEGLGVPVYQAETFEQLFATLSGLGE